MLFQTHQFLIFFVVIYWIYLTVQASHKTRNVILLISSYYFYGAWNAKFLLLIIASTSFDYYLGLKIADSENEKHRKIWLTTAVVSNLSLLGFFKYYNFFVDSFRELFLRFGMDIGLHTLSILLPVGISFYTFESMSYIIDVYRRKNTSCRSLLEYAVFISFFPHLVAGPIIRPAFFFPALRIEPRITQYDFFSGFSRCVIGLFKKLILADTLALYWGDEIFANPSGFTSLDVWIGVYCYSFQIYLDFSSYSDIAIGLSKMMGIHLPENFNYPYLARNLREFWERWHISLSTWLRDYLYIPLGGNRKGSLRKYVNIFVTMLLGGLWHGASWNFVIWGVLHGFFITVSHFKIDCLQTPSFRFRLPSWIKVLVTFHLVALAWIFFRAETFAVACQILLQLSQIFKENLYYTGPAIIPMLLLICSLLHIGHVQHIKTKVIHFIATTSLPLRVAAAVAAVALILISQQHFKPFIYFQF